MTSTLRASLHNSEAGIKGGGLVLPITSCARMSCLWRRQKRTASKAAPTSSAGKSASQRYEGKNGTAGCPHGVFHPFEDVSDIVSVSKSRKRPDPMAVAPIQSTDVCESATSSGGTSHHTMTSGKMVAMAMEMKHQRQVHLLFSFPHATCPTRGLPTHLVQRTNTRKDIPARCACRATYHQPASPVARMGPAEGTYHT